MNKRGAIQHVEMIVASILFIFFFAFVLLFIKPYETNVLSESLIDGIEYELKENCSIEVVHIFVKVPVITEEGFSFHAPNYLELSNKKCIAFDIEGNSYECKVFESSVNIGSNMRTNYNILFSEDFISENLNFTGVSVNFGGSTETDAFSYKRLKEIKQLYDSNYEEAKKQLGLPLSYDFSLSSSILNMTKKIPESVEVLGRDFVFPVIYENGTIINERFLLRVW